MRKPRTIKDGQTIRIKDHTIIRDICCNCGLSHITKYYISGSYIYAQTWLDTQYKPKCQK